MVVSSRKCVVGDASKGVVDKHDDVLAVLMGVAGTQQRERAQHARAGEAAVRLRLAIGAFDQEGVAPADLDDARLGRRESALARQHQHRLLDARVIPRINPCG